MDVFTTERRSAVMRAVKCKDTAPEMEVRRTAYSLGFRYRLHRKDLPGCPDLVFSRFRKVIFVHGCFWHQHNCPAAARPASRSEYWNKKLDSNKKRDKSNLSRLRSLGWRILVVWECQIKTPGQLAKRLTRFLGKQE